MMAVTVNRGRAALHALSILGDHSVELLSTQSQPIALVFISQPTLLPLVFPLTLPFSLF